MTALLHNKNVSPRIFLFFYSVDSSLEFYILETQTQTSSRKMQIKSVIIVQCLYLQFTINIFESSKDVKNVQGCMMLHIILNLSQAKCKRVTNCEQIVYNY